MSVKRSAENTLKTSQLQALRLFESTGISPGALVNYVMDTANGSATIDFGVVMSVSTCDVRPYAKARVFWMGEPNHIQILLPSEMVMRHTRVMVR